LDWARVILREDARAGDVNAPTDHLAEPWAVPLQEARLSSFLSALPDGSGNTVEDDKLAQQVLLSGQIVDLQSRLNVTNLLVGEQLDPKTVIAFERLFDVLGVPSAQLSLLTRGLLAAQRQGKYGEFYDRLMALRGEPTEAAMRAEAERIGMDIARWQRDMLDPALQQRIDANLELARALRIEGTPALIIGDAFIPGAVPLADLERAVSEVRRARR
jgi:hypothetical protein